MNTIQSGANTIGPLAIDGAWVHSPAMDVAVDLRTGSPTFGRWEAVRLDDQSRRSVFLAEGLGHAFMALSESHSMHCQRRAGGRPTWPAIPMRDRHRG